MAVSDYINHILLPDDTITKADLQFTMKYNCDEDWVNYIRTAYGEGTHDIRYVVNSEVVYSKIGGAVGLWDDGTGDGTVERQEDAEAEPLTGAEYPLGVPSQPIWYTLSAADVAAASLSFDSPFDIEVELKRYQDSEWSTVITETITITEAAGSPTKATNPTPADSATPGVDFSDWTLSWEDGGGSDTYNIVAVDWDGYSGAIVSGLTDPVYTIPALSGFRNIDLSSTIQWRIDSVNESGTTTGDTWEFDPRPAKATTPSPSDEDTDQSIYTTTISWAAAAQADTYKVYFEHGLEDYLGETADTEWVFPDDTDTVLDILPLEYGTIQTWRVDSVNEFGTTEGDEWTFTTLDWDPPHTTVRLLEGGSATTGPFDPETMYITGENFVAGMRRLLAFCGNSMWYESIDQADS